MSLKTTLKLDGLRYCSDKYHISVSQLGGGKFVKTYLTSELFRYVVWFRLGNWLETHRSLWTKPILLIAKVVHKMQCHSLGIQVDLKAKIGAGLMFVHYSNIVIKCKSIGSHCTIFQGVTIGNSFRKKTFGVPEIGDNVVIFAGAKVLGNIKVGNNVVIAANAVVLDNIPDNCIIGGIPAKIISRKTENVVTNI